MIASDWTGEASDAVRLSAAASRISTAASSREILNEIVAFVTALTHCDSSAIFLVEGNDLILRASSSSYPTPADCIGERVGRHHRWNGEQWDPIVVTEMAYKDPRFRVFATTPDEIFQAFISAPMLSGGRLVGVINAQFREPREFLEDEVCMISTMATLVATTIDIMQSIKGRAVLEEKLQSRDQIEQATRILQSETGISQNDAYLFIQRQSRQRRKPMRDIAAALILDKQMSSPRMSSDSSDPSLSAGNPELLS